MRALVTGATGFVGQHLCRALLENHIEVWGTYRSTPAPDLPEVRWAKMNLEAESPLAEDFPRYDFVFHLAGRLFGRNWSEFYRTNVQGTEKLLRSLDLTRSRVFMVSSLAAAGPGHKSSTSESQPVSLYGRSKRDAEVVARNLSASTCVIRPPIIYGPEDRGMFPFFQMVAQGWAPQFRGRSYSAIYVADFCDWLIKLMRHEDLPHHPLYLAHSEILTSNAILEAMGTALAQTPRIIPIPNLALWGSHWLLKVLQSGFGLKLGSLTADKLREILEDTWTCDSREAEELAGYRAPTSFSKGAEITALWYREKSWL